MMPRLPANRSAQARFPTSGASATSRQAARVTATAALLLLAHTARAAEPLRIGVIGCDTSHAGAFTDIFNAPGASGDLANLRVVAAFPTVSDDIPQSRDRVGKFTDELKRRGVEIVDSIETLLGKVDAVLVQSVDGRKHLEQARAVIAAGKPVFVDKPMAASVEDALTMFRLADENKVPIFSSSALRFGPDIVALRKEPPQVGDVVGCDARSPCALEPHHPDLFWYGIHGVEMLFAVMGPGCESVSRVHTPDTDFVVGVWRGGRVGTFRGMRSPPHEYGVTIFGAKGTLQGGKFAGYQPLVAEIGKFFRTGNPPVAAAETLEILAFMQAADLSLQANGASVRLADVLDRAKASENSAR